MNRIIVTGTTGQIGYFVAKQALEKGMVVCAPVRYSASGLDRKFEEREDIYNHPNFTVVTADLVDNTSLSNVVRAFKPNYFVNCAAQAHVAESWRIPIATAEITGLGPIRCLDAIYHHAPEDCKFVQCSTSEMFGKNQEGKIDESTPLKAMSPYGAAKIYAHEMVRVYRESYDMSCACAIMFNNESHLRTPTYFTRKITHTMGQIYRGEKDVIEIGNLNFNRDWGHSYDYARAIHLMLESENKTDYVISTGRCHTGEDFIKTAFNYGNLHLGEKFFSKEKHIRVNPAFYRPNDLTYLCGDSSKINFILGWEPKIMFEDLVDMMVRYDLTPSLLD